MSAAAPPPITDWRAVAKTLRAPGLVALAIALVAIYVCVRELPSLFGAVTLPRSVAAEATEKSAERTEQYKASFEGHLAQINGRSIFYVPGAPRKAKVEEKPKDDTPAAPTAYGGPKILAMVNNKVWFDDATSLFAGGDPKGDVKVLSINGPWSAKIEWRGVQFDVPLFDRTTDRFIDRPKPARPEPPPDTKPDEAPPSDTPAPGSDAPPPAPPAEPGAPSESPPPSKDSPKPQDSPKDSAGNPAPSVPAGQKE